jgi:peptidoglycan/LPS O-acetylase OafA/YrhL
VAIERSSMSLADRRSAVWALPLRESYSPGARKALRAAGFYPIMIPMTPQRSRVDVLDGLRGVAILMVLWFHTWQLTWLRADVHILGQTLNFNFISEMGFFGVDLFFFLSGFVLFYPYARHLFEGKQLQTVGQFAYRRMIKIVPSYVFSAILILVILRPDIGQNFVQRAWQIVSHALFIFNWWPSTSGAISGVYWTLGVEVQFYVLFPLLCWFFRRRPLITYLVLLVIANLYRAGVASCCMENGYRLLYQLPAYLDIFAAGMLAAYVAVYARAKLPNLHGYRWGFALVAIASFVVFGALLMNIFNARYTKDIFEIWQAHNRVYLGLTFFALGVASTLAPRWWHYLLGNPILIFFATISYNLYLYHQVIADQMYYHLHWPRSAAAYPRSDAHWQLVFTLAAFAIAIAWSALVTYAFERPILKRGFAALLFWRYRRKAPAGAPV